jgi:hypothetical protein
MPEDITRPGGSLVYRRHVLSSREKGISHKFELRWSRPMVIVKYLAPNVVLLALRENERVKRKAHLSQIKRYYELD